MLRPLFAALVLFAGSAAAAPRLGVHAFTGPSAADTEAALVAAFRKAGGVDLVEPAVVAQRLQAARPAPGWLGRPDEVRRVLARIDLDLLVSGRVRREKARDVLTVYLRAARTGRIVSAARVERSAGDFAETAARMTLRLRDLAFAALSLPPPREVVAAKPRKRPPDLVRPPAPTADEPDEPTPPEPEPEAEPAPVVAATPGRVVHEVAPEAPPARPIVEGGGAVSFMSWSRAGLSMSALVLGATVDVFPAARAGAGAASDLGLHLGLEGSVALRAGEGGGAAADGAAYLRFFPGLRYRIPLGGHELAFTAGYDLRELRARTVSGATTRDHLLTVQIDGSLHLGSGVRLSPLAAVSPAGTFAGTAGHRFALSGGLLVTADLAGALIGAFYRLDHLRGSAENGLVASAFNDTVHHAGVTAGVRF